MLTANFKPNTIFRGDNLDIMRGMNSECVDLIYLDPPFNSNVVYMNALGNDKDLHAHFSDVWTLLPVDIAWMQEEAKKIHPCLYEVLEAAKEAYNERMQAYLINIAVRLYEMQRILKPTGSIYLHCDQTAGHYIKIIMDCVFGHKNFVNEIVWSYRTGGASKKHFSKKHDVIFFYTKNKNKYIFNHQKEKAYTKSKSRNAGIVNYGKGKAEFFEDDYGVYNLVGMRDVWEISYINSQSKERTGYPTQKPLELLHRIISASSNEGDLIFDPFCGCTTTMVAAQQLNREWAGIDLYSIAIKLLYDRMHKEADTTNINVEYDIPKLTDDTKPIADAYSSPGKSDCVGEEKTLLYQDQKGICNGCKHFYRCRHFEVDHIHPTSKNGADTIENKQLLCGQCNGTKGDRTMEYLYKKLKEQRMMHPDYIDKV